MVNGANGIIRDILFDQTNNLPHTVFIEFENYSGLYFYPNSDARQKRIPVYPISIYNNTLGGSRSQIPLRLAYARQSINPKVKP